MEIGKKSKLLAGVSTYHTDDQITYSHRIKMLEETVKAGVDFDLYGRQVELFKANETLNKVYRGCLGVQHFDAHAGEHMIGKELLADYQYTIEMDHGKDIGGVHVKNYFSERLFDSLLLGCLPFYFGSDNLHEYLPAESFVYIDITTEESRKKSAKIIKEVVTSNRRNESLEAIKEARYLLLNKYQIWPFVYDKIKGLL